ncbi:MAG: hypothetical protein KKD29_03845 [Candidatus Omnitrophica bacterium]|nr:hypothetical protein [Candidatus Omnitrophota bacterium]
MIFLLCVLFLIKATQSDIRFIFWIFSGVFLAAGCDVLIKHFFFHQRVFPKSAIISGFIVSGIINYTEPWLVLAVFTILAIVSKNLFRFKGKHIFNPANFALFLATLFRIPFTWGIESNIFVIIVAGLYIVYSMKKIPHVLGFLLFFSIPLMAQQINPISLVSFFFIFIMLIEPKTSGFGNMRGFIFGSITGLTSFLMFKYLPSYDIFVTSLFIANAFSPILEKLKSEK